MSRQTGTPRKAGPVEKQVDVRKANMHEASSVTKDFLLLSQPFINQGILIASAKSGRRLYIHHLSEVPLGEVFLTRNGNHLQRTEPKSATLSGTITLAVEDIPPLPVASVQMTQAIPTKVFSGPISVRDAAVLKLLQQGKQANGGGDFSAACACFEAAYALSVRAGMLVSAANMRLKLSQPATAAAMYRYVLEACELLPAESQMAARKLAEAQAMLKEKGIESSPAPPAAGSSRGSGGASSVFDSFASFGFEDADSDGAGSDDGGARRPGGSEFGLDGGFGGESGLSSFGGGGGSAIGTFDADFGDFDDAAEGFDASFGDESPARPPPPPPPAAPAPAAFAAFPRAPPPATAVSGGGYGDSAALELGGGDDGFSDFGDFDDAVPSQQPTSQQSSAAASGGGFAAFATPPPPPPSPPAATPILATPQPGSTLGGSAGAVVAAGGSTGGGAGYAALEERLRALEQRASAPPAGLAEVEARLERLSAQVERRLTGVKSGMKGLHERLQAVEVALAKLPGHLTKLKERQATQARLGAEQAASLRRLEGALPALSAAAAACAERMAELASLRGELELGDVTLGDLALGEVGTLAEGGFGGAMTGRHDGGLRGGPYYSSGAGALLSNGFGGGAVGSAMGGPIPDTVGGSPDAGGGLALAASSFGGFGSGTSILSAAFGGASGAAAPPVPQEAGSQPGLSQRSVEAMDGFGDFDDAPVTSASSASASFATETPAAAAACGDPAAPSAAAWSALPGTSPGADSGGVRSTDTGGVPDADTGGVGGFGGFGEFEDGAPAADAEEARGDGLAGGAGLVGGLRAPQPSPARVPPSVRFVPSHEDDFGAFDDENSPAAAASPVGRADAPLGGGAGGLTDFGAEEPMRLQPTVGVGQAPAEAGLDFGSFGADDEASGGAGGFGAFPSQAAVGEGAVGGAERTVSDDEFNALFGVTE